MTDEPMKCMNCGLDSRYREPLFLQPESGTAVIGRLAAQLLTINNLYDLAEVHRKIGELIDSEGSTTRCPKCEGNGMIWVEGGVPGYYDRKIPCPSCQRPPLPTSGDWLKEDGLRIRWGNSCKSDNRGWNCLKVDGHDGWHTTCGGGERVLGRWYTDDPFLKAAK